MAAKAIDIENVKTALMHNNAKMKEWVNTQIGDVKIFSLEWVEELPTENISTDTIYLVKDESSTNENNIYIEYVYKQDEGWELLGTVDAGSVDLENYYDKTTIDELLENLVTSCTNEEIIEIIDEVWSE